MTLAELNFDELFREALVDDGIAVPVQLEPDVVESTANPLPVEGEGNVVAPVLDTTTDDELDPDTDYKVLYEQEKQRTASWDGRLKAKDRENEAIKAEAMALKRQVEAAALTKDQQAIDDADESVTTFLTEFPELADPIRKMIDSAVKSTRLEMRADVEREVTPLRQTAMDTTLEKHLSTIRGQHEDFDAIIESGTLKTWIDAQPSFLRKAYSEVYNAGTATEVVDLIDQFRVANPKAEDGVVVTPASQGTRHKPTQAVRTRSSGIPTTRKRIEKDDFNGAWEAALASE